MRLKYSDRFQAKKNSLLYIFEVLVLFVNAEWNEMHEIKILVYGSILLARLNVQWHIHMIVHDRYDRTDIKKIAVRLHYQIKIFLKIWTNEHAFEI